MKMVLRKNLILSFFDDNFVKRINIVLTGLCCLFFIFLVVSVFFKPRGVQGLSSWTQRATADLPESKLSKKSPKYYQRILGRRSLFVAQPGLMDKKIDSQATVFPEGRTNLFDLQIVGIISGPQGLQAIISNEKTGQSFYCWGGENVDGFIVKQVFADKIILEKDDQLFEMRL